jgi:hypothetical protein
MSTGRPPEHRAEVPHTPPGSSGLGVLVVVAVIGLLHRLGAGPLAAPGVGSVAELERWLEVRDAVTVGVAVLRVLALAVGYHLLVTTALVLVGRAIHRPALVRWADAATPPPLRAPLRRLAGLGLSASAVLATPLPPAGAAPEPTRSTVVVERIEDHHETGGSATLRVVPEAEAPPGGATLRLVEPLPPPPPPSADPTGWGADPPSPAAAPVVTEERPLTHVVRPGDHLWWIAEERLADHLGRAPSDTEVAPFWRALVVANPQLVDADLLFPGELVHVPPLTAG